MELEQLRMFVSAARSGSFSAAGRSLYTSRSNRQLALTGAGELLLEEGAELLSAADRLEMKLKSMEEAGE